jgi:hypothetical protein
MDTTLKVVRDGIFEEPEFDIIPTSQRQASQTVKQLLHCYNVAEAEEPEEYKLCNIQIPKVEGEREVEGPKLDS